MAASKGRFFAFIVPKKNFKKVLKLLKQTHGDYLISPLHHADTEYKFAHYHVIYRHSNTITLSLAKKKIPEGCALNDYVIMLDNQVGYQRYLLHLDDPDKEQFEGGIDELTVLGQFPVDISKRYTATEKAQLKIDLIAFIEDHDLREFSDFIQALIQKHDIDAVEFASNNTYFFDKYITSRRNKYRRTVVNSEDIDF